MDKLPTPVRQAKRKSPAGAVTGVRQSPGAQAMCEQAALHHTRLALARWRMDIPPTAPPEALQRDAQQLSRQARWHAQQQEHFLAWLNDGGFSRQERDLTAHASDPAWQAS
jgi:hypothetical protein